MTEPELSDPWWHLLEAQRLLSQAQGATASFGTDLLIKRALAHATLARRIAEVTLAERAGGR